MNLIRFFIAIAIVGFAIPPLSAEDTGRVVTLEQSYDLALASDQRHPAFPDIPPFRPPYSATAAAG